MTYAVKLCQTPKSSYDVRALGREGFLGAGAGFGRYLVAKDDQDDAVREKDGVKVGRVMRADDLFVVERAVVLVAQFPVSDDNVVLVSVAIEVGVGDELAFPVVEDVALSVGG